MSNYSRLSTLLAIASCLLGAYALNGEARLKQLDARYLDDTPQQQPHAERSVTFLR